MRKFAAFMATLLLFITVGTIPVAHAQTEPNFEFNAKGVYLVNMDSGQVLYEKNAQEKMYPASLSKILTTIVAIENCDDLDGTMVEAKSYIYDEFYGLNVSTADIRRGETLSVRQLLYAMMLQSANEAASIVADYFGNGSISAFAEMMNQKAQEIGATNSHFVNPHGLYNDEQYTTPYDLYLITNYALTSEKTKAVFNEIIGTTRYQIPATDHNREHNLVTTNLMMDRPRGGQYYYEPVKGVKTGTLDEAGRCLISTASKDGYNYMLVLLGARVDDRYSAFTESKAFYEWAFKNFSYKTVLDEPTVVGEIKVNLAWDKDHTLLYPEKPFSYILPNEVEASDIQQVVNIPDSINAPIKKGQEIGYVSLRMADEEIARVKLVAGEDISRSNILYILDTIGRIFSSVYTKILLVIVLVLVIVYIFVFISINQKKKKKSGGKTYKKVKRKKRF